MKKDSYIDSEGNVVNMPDHLSSEIEGDALDALRNFARIPVAAFALSAFLSVFVFVANISAGDPALVALGVLAIGGNSVFCIVWLSLLKGKRWAFIPAQISCIAIFPFIPVGTIVGFLGLKRLKAARDSFCE